MNRAIAVLHSARACLVRNHKLIDIFLRTAGLTVAVAGVIIAYWSLDRRIERVSDRGERTEKRLEIVEDNIGPLFDIEKPRKDEVITDEVYNDMHGTFRGTIPRGYRVCVVAKDAHNYFLMLPVADVIDSRKEWFQTNVMLSSPGRWRLNVCLANKQGAQFLSAVIAGDQSAVCEQLPEGIEVKASVLVERK
jgi:hypothetical protein